MSHWLIDWEDQEKTPVVTEGNGFLVKEHDYIKCIRTWIKIVVEYVWQSQL